MKKYTIECISDEKTYYLVNKSKTSSKADWFNKKSVLEDVEYAKKFFFNKPSQARSSLTKLLKAIPGYKNNKFTLVEL